MSHRIIVAVLTAVLLLIGSSVGLAMASPGSPDLAQDFQTMPVAPDLQPGGDTPPGLPVKFEGEVVSVDVMDGNGTIDVHTAGVSVTVEISTSVTVVVGELTPGAHVEVKGWLLLPDTEVLAARVTVEEISDDGPCYEFYGKVNSVVTGTTGLTLTVGNTEVFVPADVAADVSVNIEVGVMVKVEVCLSEGGLTASEVELVDFPGHHYHRRVIRGNITDTFEGGLVLSMGQTTYTVEFGTDLVILPPYLTEADLKVGDRVVAKGEVPDGESDTDLIAYQIVVLGAGGPEEGVEPVVIEGEVISNSPGVSLTVGGIVVSYTETTVIVPPIREIEAGDWVVVHAKQHADGALAALRIVIKPFSDEAFDLRFVGNFEGTDGVDWIVSGQRFEVPPEIAAAPPPLGTRIVIWADYVDGTLTVTNVHIGD